MDLFFGGRSRVVDAQNKFAVLAARLATDRQPWCLVYSQSVKEIAKEAFNKLKIHHTDLELNELETIISKEMNSLPTITISSMIYFEGGIEIQLSSKYKMGIDEYILALVYYHGRGSTIYFLPYNKWTDDDYHVVSSKIPITDMDWNEFKNFYNGMVS